MNGVKLSVVVVVYRMRRQAMNTLLSLSASYQQGVREEDYEVIVVENASDQNLDPQAVSRLGGNFRYYLREENLPTPVFALDEGVRRARGDQLCIMIDGARMLTPGVLRLGMLAAHMFPFPLVAVPGYHLGRDLHQEVAGAGYDSEEEARLLESIGWPQEGYRLFEICCLSNANPGGVINPMMESNCFFFRKTTLEEAGGIDLRFDLPGGGMLNLDLYRRIGLVPGTELVVTPGEGSFHQYHGGVTTRHDRERERLVREFQEQYIELRGVRFQGLRRQPFLLGRVPPQAYWVLDLSSRHALNRLEKLRRLGHDLWPDEPGSGA